MRRLFVAAACALVVAPSALAGGTKPLPGTPPQATAHPRLTKQAATAALLAVPKVRDWLHRYPKKSRTTNATYSAKYRNWTAGVWWDPAGEIAMGRVDDATGAVTEAWTGPQVAWKMARGYDGAFGGKEINSAPVWLAFCAVFLLGRADRRRPLTVRNPDLLV